MRYLWERPDLLQSPEMARPGISTKNTDKNTPQAEILKPKENTPKIPKKYQKRTFFGYFLGVFFRGILGVNSGSPEFQPGGYFFGIFRGNSGSGHLGSL